MTRRLLGGNKTCVMWIGVKTLLLRLMLVSFYPFSRGLASTHQLTLYIALVSYDAVKQFTLLVLTVVPPDLWVKTLGPTARAVAPPHAVPPVKDVGAGVGRTVGVLVGAPVSPAASVGAAVGGADCATVIVPEPTKVVSL